MANGDSARLVQLRDIAVAALKRTPLFRNASWRLLSDYVDAIDTIRPVGGGLTLAKLEILVVLFGRVQLRQAGTALASLDPGIYVAEPGAPFHGEADVEILPDPTGTAVIFSISKEQWEEINQSFDLTRSLVLQGLPDDIKTHLMGAVDPSSTELVWVVVSDRLAGVSAQPGLVAQLLLHFLAAGMSRTVPRDRIFAVRIAGTHFWLEKWLNGTLEGPLVEGTDFAGTVGASLSAGNPPQRLLVCWSEPGPRPPPTAAFDRVVYLHDEGSALFPTSVFVNGPPLSSTHTGPPAEAQARGFYTSRLSVSLSARPRAPQAAPSALPGDGTPESVGTELRHSLGQVFAGAIDLLARRRHFEARPLLDTAGAASGKASRIERDATRLELAVATLLQQWQLFQGTSAPGSFAEHLFTVDDSFLSQADKLGRALAGKRVGIAVSGGGASAFRIGPLLELIGSGSEQVDIDYFSGVSGGALVGAYYCALGIPGINSLVAESERLQWVLPLLSVSSWPLEAWVDNALGGRRVEQLSTPAFLAVTTELAGEAAPRAVVITAGTLGEAVRASGSLPLGFGPTEKNGRRYTDGAAAGLIPKQMLDDKADVILACNAVPGPRHSNPWYDVEPVVLAHRHTPVGRLIDLWTWTAFMLQNATRDSALGSDVILEFDPDRIAMRESVEWGRAREVVADARSDPRVAAAAKELYHVLQNAGTSTPTPPKAPLPGGT